MEKFVVTKATANAKDLDTKTVTQIQNKLLELDFSYKPVVDSDLDSNINFNSLSTQEKKYLKGMTHLNWNKPLPEDRYVRFENPVLNDLNKKIGNIKDKFFFVTVNETEDKYGPRKKLCFIDKK